ncbi:MAG: ATP-binding protein [Candidatus Muiribacteriota bacterium]|jgi:predicted AAA+ superfamily ATPase
MIKRETFLKRIRPFYNSDLIKIITGVRRSGKSTLLNQIIFELKEQNIEDSNIIYLNFENLDYSFIKNEMDLHKFIKEKIKNKLKYYLIFDEIQNVENFEKAINSFRATFDCSIFITGSNGKLLSGELSTHLSGRYVSFKIMPFSFKEMCEIKNIKKENVNEGHFFDYFNYGGMPQRFLMENDEMIRVYLNDLYNSIVLRDIMQRSNIKDIDILNRIIEYLVINTSQTFSAKSISNFFKSANRSVSVETIYHYLEYITSSLFLNKAVRFDIYGKRVLTRSDKYYLTDPGFAKIKKSGLKADIGPMIENIIFNELLHRGYDVYVGKTPKGEVDFIALNNNERVYYQVAYLLADEKIIKREFEVFNSIKDNYPKFVLSLDKMDFSQHSIKHKNIIDFLLE